jgi:uncharacterized protein YhfF
MMNEIEKWLKSFFPEEVQKNVRRADCDAWRFEESVSEELIALVLAGKKRATASPYLKGDKQSTVGSYGVILDYTKTPKCLVRYTASEAKSFSEVTIDFARKEGEGFESIEQWRDEHLALFRQNYPNFSDTDLVLCEEFDLIKPNLPES